MSAVIRPKTFTLYAKVYIPFYASAANKSYQLIQMEIFRFFLYSISFYTKLSPFRVNGYQFFHLFVSYRNFLFCNSFSIALPGKNCAYIISWKPVERRSINIFSAWTIQKLIIFYNPPFNVLLRSRFLRYNDLMLVTTSAYDNNGVSLIFAISIFLLDSPIIPDFRSRIASPRRRTKTSPEITSMGQIHAN